MKKIIAPHKALLCDDFGALLDAKRRERNLTYTALTRKSDVHHRKVMHFMKNRAQLAAYSNDLEKVLAVLWPEKPAWTRDHIRKLTADIIVREYRRKRNIRIHSFSFYLLSVIVSTRLSRKEFAERLGMTAKGLWVCTEGETSCSPRVARLLEERFNVTVPSEYRI